MQQAGTSLQMLIVDEGFGIADLEGCDRISPVSWWQVLGGEVVG